MAVFTGKNLFVSVGGTTITDVTQIVVNETTNAAPFVTSSTSASTSRVAGATDASGSFTALGPVVQAATVKGTTGTIICKSSASDTVFTGAVLIGDTSHSTNAEGLVTYTVNWGKT